jgi:Leucine-rich repeat (LRR) protein
MDSQESDSRQENGEDEQDYFELEDKKESEFESEIGQIGQTKDREIKLRVKKCAIRQTQQLQNLFDNIVELDLVKCSIQTGALKEVNSNTIKCLLINHCNISYDDVSMMKMKELARLDLSFNRIRHIEKIDFGGLKNLKALVLKGNQIEFDTKESFISFLKKLRKECPELQEINLEANPFETVITGYHLIVINELKDTLMKLNERNVHNMIKEEMQEMTPETEKGEDEEDENDQIGHISLPSLTKKIDKSLQTPSQSNKNLGELKKLVQVICLRSTGGGVFAEDPNRSKLVVCFYVARRNRPVHQADHPAD